MIMSNKDLRISKYLIDTATKVFNKFKDELDYLELDLILMIKSKN